MQIDSRKQLEAHSLKAETFLHRNMKHVCTNLTASMCNTHDLCNKTRVFFSVQVHYIQGCQFIVVLREQTT